MKGPVAGSRKIISFISAYIHRRNEILTSTLVFRNQATRLDYCGNYGTNRRVDFGGIKDGAGYSPVNKRRIVF